MALSELLLPEFDQEMAATRRVLDRIEDAKFDFKPHPKSMSMGKLASHIAELTGWATAVLEGESFEVAPVGGPPMTPFLAASKAEVLARFDAGVTAGHAALAKASDAELTANWSLLNGGRAMFTLPRMVTLRNFVFNHTVHHRAQLGVYLRLNDIAVPSIYGPSADEGRA
ncbi:MAG: DinB family protein [Bryobacteraceae bacterium]